MTQPLIRVTAMPTGTNPYGSMFGGWLMGQSVSRHTGGKAVVV